MQRTYLAFLHNAKLRSLPAVVKAVQPFASLDEANKLLYKQGTPEGDHVVVTDQTIFHPQGGGQPSDEGVMTSSSSSSTTTFNVSMVRVNALVDGEVLHFGRFSSTADSATTTSTFQPGEAVTQTIDGDKRDLYSRYHTAGHVLGAAVRHSLESEVAGFDELHAEHFPATAACNFSGLIEGKWKDVIQERIDDYVSRDMAVEITWWDESDFRERGLERLIPDRKALRMAEGEKFRVVEIVGAEAYPCGGTHVDSTALCGKTNVRKISRSKGTSRVSYVLP